MIAKIRTGVEFFDERYGGAYRGRAMLVCGRSDAGKSIFGLQFIAQGVREGERCLLLSVRPSADVVLYAEAIGLAIATAVDNGSVIVLEYSDYVPGRHAEAQLNVPPEGFVQLQEVIEANAIQRVVLDTCLPWVSSVPPEAIARHVFSFVRSFDRLGATTVLTLPKPISPVAFKLKSILEDIVPVAVTLALDESTDGRCWIVNKYLGEARLDSGTDFAITKGIGLHATAAVAAEPRPVRASEPAAPPTPAPPPVVVPGAPPSVSAAPPAQKRVRFADVILGNAASHGERKPL